MIQSRGGRHWCPLFGSEHVHGSRSSGRAVGTAAGASARSAELARAVSLRNTRPRASFETYRHGPAPVPREDSAHALGHRLARPEVLLDAGPGRLSCARNARAIHRGAYACPSRGEARRPGRYAPRRRRRAERSARDLGRCAKKRERRKNEESDDAALISASRAVHLAPAELAPQVDFRSRFGAKTASKNGNEVREFDKNVRPICVFFRLHVWISNRDRRKKICIAYAAAPLPKTSRTREASVRPSSSRRGRARDAPRFRHTRTDGTRFRSGRAGARRAAVSARPTQPVPECETIENREIANR